MHNQNSNQKSVLVAARRTMGMTSMGLPPSNMVLQNLVRQLDRELPKDMLVSTREVFQKMLENRTMPTQKVAHAAMQEIRTLFESMAPADVRKDIVAMEDVDDVGNEAPSPKG